VSVLGRWLRAVGLAIWNFLVGDTPEFLPAVLVIVLLAFALHSVRDVAVFALPGAVVLVLGGSLAVWQLRSRARRDRSSA
jgi:hypothetical protein